MASKCFEKRFLVKSLFAIAYKSTYVTATDIAVLMQSVQECRK